MQPIFYFSERPTLPCEGRSTAADPKNEAKPSLECTQRLGIPASDESSVSGSKFLEGRSDGYQKTLQNCSVPNATSSETPASPYSPRSERTNFPSQNIPERTVDFNRYNPMEQHFSTTHLPNSNENTVVPLQKSSLPKPERPGVLDVLDAEPSENNSALYLGRPEKPVLFNLERSDRLRATHSELCKRHSAPCLGRSEKPIVFNPERSDVLGNPHAELCKRCSAPCLGRPEMSILNPEMPDSLNATYSELHEIYSVPYLGKSKKPFALKPPRSDGCRGPCARRPEKPDVLKSERSDQLRVHCMGKPDALKPKRSDDLTIPSSGRPEKSDDRSPKSPDRLGIPCQGRSEKPNILNLERADWLCIPCLGRPEKAIVLNPERPSRLCVSNLGGPGKPDILNHKRPDRHCVPCLGRPEKSNVLHPERSDRLGVTFLGRAEKPDVFNPKRTDWLCSLNAEFYERCNVSQLGRPEKPLVLKSVKLNRFVDAANQKTCSEASENRCGTNFRKQRRRHRVPYFKPGRQNSVHEKDRQPSTRSSGFHSIIFPETAFSPFPERLCIPWMETPEQIPCPMRSNVSLFKGLRKVLILVAHPDDECMFFAPTILNLIKLQHLVFVVCFSSGNYYNQGAIRKDELVHSCGVLGIPPSRVTVIEHRDLPDSPDTQWDPLLLSNFIMQHVQANHINLVLTFDKGGVSGHINHISLFDAVRYLLSAGKLGEGCPVLILETVNIIRKYLSILDVPISWLQRDDVTFMLTSQEYRRAKRAMMCHQSQLMWFRHMYLLFSRYMWINSLNFLSGKCDIKTQVETLETKKTS